MPAHRPGVFPRMTRVLSALAFLPLVVGVVWWLPGVWTLVLVEVVLVLALREYLGLVARIGVRVPSVVTVVGALAVSATMAWWPWLVPGVVMAAAVGAGVVRLVQGPPAGVFTSVSASVFGLVYLAMPLGALAALRVEGREIVLLLVLTVMASDTFQYYGGRAFGRRPLAPSLSPGKTVEGACFGVVAAIAVMVVVGHAWLEVVSPGWRVAAGAAIAGCGIAGDLFESGLKRSADVKDASGLIPGHGGMLDRVDGLLFAVPCYYLLVQLQ